MPPKMPNETPRRVLNEPPSPPWKRPQLLQWDRGVVPPRIVRLVTFSVITFSLLICTTLCVLSIWEFTKSAAAWRSISTFGVIAGASWAFAVANEKFG